MITKQDKQVSNFDKTEDKDSFHFWSITWINSH